MFSPPSSIRKKASAPDCKSFTSSLRCDRLSFSVIGHGHSSFANDEWPMTNDQGLRMMQVLPAIDLRGGKCVRLRQGDYAQETVFGNDPAAMAQRWVDEGARYLHLVDLDGAREGRPVNGDSVRRIVAAAGVPCQLGGGLRSEEHVAEALGWGVARVVVGTRALKDPAGFEALCRRFPGRVVLG